MSASNLLLAACLLSSTAAFAQTTPSTTRSTNTVGLGGTVSGTPTSGTNAAPVRYDDPNSGMPSQVQMKTKGTKTKSEKHSRKMKSNL